MRPWAAGSVLAAILVTVATDASAGTQRLHAVFKVAWNETSCARGTPATTSCYLNVGRANVPRLGHVTERYVLLVEHTDTDCADWRFSAVLTVAGKGSIRVRAFRPGCFSPFEQAGISKFTITGGTGAYRGAKGSGKIASTGSETKPGGGVGVDTWTGTVKLPRSVAATTRLSDTLTLVAAFPVDPNKLAAPCPAGTPSSTECFAFSVTAPVPGLGTVTESYMGFEDQSDSTCRRSTWSPAVLSVAGKGEIDASLLESGTCDPRQAFIGPANFTITGGTGLYAGATGGGSESAANFLSDVWNGSLTVPGLTFDTIPPVLRGAKSRTVRVPKGAKRARVRFSVSATDAVDGSVAATCVPGSGSRFRIGRTEVTCSATDSSANEAGKSFVITLKRR